MSNADELVCSNCGGTWNVKRLSYDLDLPTIVLCGVCAILIVTNPEEFKGLERQ